MKTDEIVDWIGILENENKVLQTKNNQLNQQVRRLKVSLESVMNILEPEQFRIIQKIGGISKCQMSYLPKKLIISTISDLIRDLINRFPQ